MRVANRFSIAVHILLLLAASDGENASSEWMAGSIGVNPVIVRRTMTMLREAGLVNTQKGVAGASIAKSLDQINLLDVFKAVESEESVFSVHQNPNPNCPVGAKIQTTLEKVYGNAQTAMEKELEQVTLNKLTKDLFTATA